MSLANSAIKSSLGLWYGLCYIGYITNTSRKGKGDQMNLAIDINQVKSLASASPTASITMLALGYMPRSRRETTLDLIKHKIVGMGGSIVQKDFMDFWKGLEQAGAGVIVLGRRGKPTRFAWNYSLKDVASMALEGKSEAKRLSFKARRIRRSVKSPALPVTIIPTSPVAAVKQERLVFKIPFRSDLSFEITLPADTTARELENVKNALVMPQAS